MKVIEKGKYTSQEITCKHCNTKYIPDNEDIVVGKRFNFGYYFLDIYVECPCCKMKKYLYNSKSDYEYNYTK